MTEKAAPLQISCVDPRAGLFRLELRGKVYKEGAAALHEAVFGALRQNMRSLVVDARAVFHFDSAALRVFVELLRNLQPAGGRLVFVGLSAPQERLFALTGLLEVCGASSADDSQVRRALARPAAGSDADLDRVEARLALLEHARPDGEPPREQDLRADLERIVVGHFTERFAERGVVQIDPEELRRRIAREVGPVAQQVFRQHGVALDPGTAERLVQQVVDELTGHGPIEPLLRDDSISEIMVNGPETVLVERRGKIEPAEVRFFDEAHVVNTIRRIASRLGRRIDFKNPQLDARLPDGSRVHAVIPPISPDGPMLTVRKFRRVVQQMEDLIATGMIGPEAALFLGACVKARLNLVLCGPASSGKTTMMNVLASLVPAQQRIVTIEDNAELRIVRPKGALVRLETRTANVEGEGEIDIRQLVRESLRMRADRIIVGEARGSEVLEILQVMRSGHDGSMTTIHATSPVDLITRMTTMAMMAGLPIPEHIVRRMVVDAVDVVVQLGRLPSGDRRVLQIAEPMMDGNLVRVEDIFRFEPSGYDERGRLRGLHRATGWLPAFLERFRQAGLDFPEEILTPA